MNNIKPLFIICAFIATLGQLHTAEIKQFREGKSYEKKLIKKWRKPIRRREGCYMHHIGGLCMDDSLLCMPCVNIPFVRDTRRAYTYFKALQNIYDIFLECVGQEQKNGHLLRLQDPRDPKDRHAILHGMYLPNDFSSTKEGIVLAEATSDTRPYLITPFGTGSFLLEDPQEKQNKEVWRRIKKTLRQRLNAQPYARYRSVSSTSRDPYYTNQSSTLYYSVRNCHAITLPEARLLNPIYGPHLSGPYCDTWKALTERYKKEYGIV